MGGRRNGLKIWKKSPNSKPKKKKSFCKSPARNFFEPFHFQQEHTITKKLHSILFGNWYHDSKTQRSTPPCLLFFSFAITRCFAKHFKYYYKYSLKLSIL